MRQRRYAVAVGQVDIGAGCHEQAHDFGMARSAAAGSPAIANEMVFPVRGACACAAPISIPHDDVHPRYLSV